MINVLQFFSSTKSILADPSQANVTSCNETGKGFNVALIGYQAYDQNLSLDM